MTKIAKSAADDAWEGELTRIALQVEPKLRAAFIKAMRDLRGTVDLAALEKALAGGNPVKVLDAVIGQTGADLAPLWEQITAAAHDAEEAASGLIAQQTGARMEAFFGASNPAVDAHFEAYRGGLIRQITEDTRAGVMQVVRQTMADGLGPAVAARQIKGMIGLTARQAQAVANYRAALADRPMQALERVLRDRRFDPTVRRAAQKEGLSQDQIDRIAGRYEERFLAYRAETIARTESIRAAQAGSYAAMQKAVTDGGLPVQAVRRFWIVARDERTCPICRGIPTLNPQGVALAQPFMASLGSVQYPPVHPSCRCAVAMRLILDQ